MAVGVPMPGRESGRRLAPVDTEDASPVGTPSEVRFDNKKGDGVTIPSAPDSIDWMKARWHEHGEPLPAKFAAMASILRTAAVLTEQLDEALKQRSLTRTAYLLLITLEMSDDLQRPMGQLSKILLVHPTTVTAVSDQLAKQRLLRRIPHPSDRRTILLRLTPAGQAAVRKASEHLAKMGFGLDGVSEGLADRLSNDLRSVRRALGD
jgi:DNA-binding MarR family transcriptional regulator